MLRVKTVWYVFVYYVCKWPKYRSTLFAEDLKCSLKEDFCLDLSECVQKIVMVFGYSSTIDVIGYKCMVNGHDVQNL